MILILQSIIVYGLMIWVMTYFGNIAYKCQYPKCLGGVDKFQNKKVSFRILLTKSYFLIPIIVFCLFSAVRYQVGVDCEAYKKSFYEIISFGELRRDIEFGFIFISKLIDSVGGTHYLFLFILAFIQIGLLYYAQRKSTYSLKFFGLVLILSGTYFSLMNGIRQNIAACAFVALLPLVLEKKKWIWYILGVFLAMQMHKTALSLFPLGIAAYFLKYRIPNKYVQLGIITVCFILMDKIQLTGITDIFATYGTEAGYDDRAVDIYSNLNATNKAFGLRSILMLSTYIITIWYSNDMEKFFVSRIFNMQYNLFFIGICLYLLFYNNFVVNRLLYYVNIFMPIIVASCMYYLWNCKNRINRLMFKIIVIVLSLHLMYELYAASQSIPIEFSLYKFDLFRQTII